MSFARLLGRTKMLNEPCEHCKLAGNISACEASSCLLSNNWHARQLKARLKQLEAIKREDFARFDFGEEIKIEVRNE